MGQSVLGIGFDRKTSAYNAAAPFQDGAAVLYIKR